MKITSDVAGVLVGMGVFLVGLPLAGSAMSAFAVEVHTASAPPLIDGVLEDVWQEADSINGFVQLQPHEGEPLSEATTAYVLQDDWALYFAFRCVTSGRRPDYREGPRDSREGDAVRVFIDTFRDRTNAYCFAVNCANVQADAVLSADGLQENLSWDGVFYSNTDLQKESYTVEIAIPWTSLRFDDQIGTWGFNLERDIPRRGEIGYSARVTQERGLRVSEFTPLQNIQPGRTGVRFDAYPSVFYRTEDSYEEQTSTFRPALDLNITPAPWMQFQSTINPDYSQVEADPFALNLSKYNLYFPEKRPFFIEGSEFFEPSGGAVAGLFDLFYSRQIGRKLPDGSEVPFDVGLRLTASRERIRWGNLFAATGSREYQSWWGPAEEDRAVYSVNRVEYRLFNQTTAALMHVGKFSRAGDNQALGFDATTSSGAMQLTGQAALSRYQDISDWAGKVYFHYVPRGFVLRAGGSWIGNEFDVSEIGFVPWQGRRSASLVAGPFLYPDRGMFYSLGLGTSLAVVREKDEALESYSVTHTLSIVTRSNWSVGVDYTYGRQYELEYRYNPRGISVYLQSDISRRIWISLSYSSANEYNYLRDYLARADYWSSYSTFRISDVFTFWVNGSGWIERDPSGGFVEHTVRLRPGFALHLADNLDLRAYEETPFSANDGTLSYRLGLSLTYNFAPKSWAYLAFNDYQYREDGRFIPRQRVVALKIRYLVGL